MKDELAEWVEQQDQDGTLAVGYLKVKLSERVIAILAGNGVSGPGTNLHYWRCTEGCTCVEELADEIVDIFDIEALTRYLAEKEFWDYIYGDRYCGGIDTEDDTEVEQAIERGLPFARKQALGLLHALLGNMAGDD